MLIINLEIMKIIDEKKQTKQRQKRATGLKATVKGWELNDFVLHLS